jgi:hypothetical protein
MSMQAFTDIFDSWNDPQMRHAMVVHLPIAFSLISAVLAVLLAIQPRNSWIRALALVVTLLLAGSAWLASGSGEGAEGATGAISAEASEELDEHEDMGVLVWFFAACAAGVVLLTFIPARVVQHVAGAVAAVGAIFIAAWTGVVAHHGGTLVYDHGVGMPTRAALTGGSDGDLSESQAVVDPRLVHFEEHVRPILEQHCWGCHNPNRRERNGGLDLTTMTTILEGGETEEEIVVAPGNAEGSLMIRAVRYDDPFLQMPPPRKGQLTPEEVATLERWVLEGAVWKERAGSSVDWASQPQEEDESAGE